MIPSIHTQSEVSRCLLCHDAPCSKGCGVTDTARAIRALYFCNIGRAEQLATAANCATCTSQRCMKACLRGRIDKPIDIPFVMQHLAKQAQLNPAQNSKLEPTLEIDFCGIRTENPFVLGSSVITSSYELCASALKAGWGGVAIKTLSYTKCDETSPRFDISGKVSGHLLGFKNLEQLSEHPVDEDLKWVARLKRDFPTKLIIVSIMGSNEQEWELLARKASENGADIIECNFSCPQMTVKGMGSDTGQSTELVKRYTQACRRATQKPILAKLTPNLSAPYNFVMAAIDGGATGIAGINTIKSLTTVDFRSDHTLGNMGRTAISGYSGRAVKPIALRFMHDTAMLIDPARHTLSGIGGIENWHDALDFILLGCTNVQICTAVMEYGQRIIEDLTQGLIAHMRECGASNIDQLVGHALQDIVPPSELDRKSILYPSFNSSKCIGCGRCYISCRDGGHQAIVLANGRTPQLVMEHCVGCHLCRLICPAEAIGIGERVAKQ